MPTSATMSPVEADRKQRLSQQTRDARRSQNNQDLRRRQLRDREDIGTTTPDDVLGRSRAGSSNQMKGPQGSSQGQNEGSSITNKDRKKYLKDQYKQGNIAGAGSTEAEDTNARQYAATGHSQPVGQKQGLLERIRQRGAEREREEQQKQYAQELARKKEGALKSATGAKIGAIGARALTRLYGTGDREKLRQGAKVARSLDAMGRNPAAIGGAMGRMAERERDLKRLNDKQRQAWKKEKGLRNKAKAFISRPKKQQGIRAKQHELWFWMVLIGMAVFKDLMDVGTIELMSWLDWIIDGAIGITFFFALGKGNLDFAQKVVKSLLPTLTEMVPGLGIVPIWTFSVIYIYWRSEFQTSLPGKPEEKKLPG